MDKENNICGAELFPLKRTPTESTIGSLSERKARYNQEKNEHGKLSMDSFITVRPPRGRRNSESVATIEPYNPAAVHNHHHPSQRALTHRHRSSSQPRPSQSVQPLPPAQMERSIRSASQPRPSQNTHFLDGFNVADCYDVRTIPDPPPPLPNNSRRRHRRRVSSAVLRLMSSMDVNNRGNNQTAASNHINGSDVKSNFITRRKRKTLSHVPSPHNPEEEEAKFGSDSTDVRGEEERCDIEARPNSLQINLCRDDGEDAIANDSQRRKKKRQSMVIPRHLPLEENDSSSQNALANGFSRESKSAKNSPSKAKKEFVPLDFKTMQKLRSLVRGYCALSPGGKRASSEAKEIESITGYSLPQKTSMTDGCNKSESVLSNRRLVIQKLAPVLAQMESRKKRDIKQWEKKTQCRVTKSERSGRYKYYDVETNKKVGSQEYKRRYISVLHEERPNRLLMARQWMDELNHQPDSHCSRKNSEEMVHSNPVDMNCLEQNDVYTLEMQQKEAFLPPRNINIVRDGTTRGRETVTVTNECNLKHEDQQSDLLLNTSDGTEIAEITEASSEDTDDNSREPRSPIPTKSDTSELIAPLIVDNISPMPAQEDECGGIHQGNDVDEEDATGSVPLLPLPSKDSESMDPDIAAAEKRLWDKIDLALHEYSGEVMMIKRKKRRLAESHPVSMELIEPQKIQNGEGN